MTISLDEHLSATLSDEELAAIRGDDLSDEDRDLLQSLADDDDGDDASAGVEDDADDGADDADADDGAQDAGATTEPPPPAEEHRSAVSYQASGLPPDFQDRLSATYEAQRELLQKLQDGDIDVSEYAAELNKVTEQRDALMAAKIKAEISQEMVEQASSREWQQAVQRFVDRVANEEKIDYRTDAARAKDLDTFVKVLANDPENADRPGEWFLAEAHKLVNARRGVVNVKQADAPGIKEKPAPRKPDLRAVPTTLSHVPGSDGPGDVGDEFAHLDALDGLDLEVAIARMTPAQREKFARAG